VPAPEAEVARARLLDVAPGGFEEVDREDAVELVVYTDELGEAAVRAAFPQAVATAVDAGWEDLWREFHRPVRAGGLWIGPPWEAPPAGVPAVVVDPGRAFGTGAHPTTRACIELLAAQPRGSVLDAGCGSGVVGLAAARLGFAPVVAVDVDGTAAEAALANAARNGLEIEVGVLDVLRSPLPACDLVVANIELAVVEALLPRVGASHAITSGYLAREAPSAPGWTIVETLELEGWAAHLCAG
jgi:ribosomal protein L11 methyltransferase